MLGLTLILTLTAATDTDTQTLTDNAAAARSMPAKIKQYNLAAQTVTSITTPSAGSADNTPFSQFNFTFPTHIIQVGDAYCISDLGTRSVYKVAPASASTGNVTRIAGNSSNSACIPGDGPSTAAFKLPVYMAAKNSSYLYLSDGNCHVIWGIDLTTNNVSVVAGVPGTAGNALGDALTQAKMNDVSGILYDPVGGKLYITDRCECTM